MQNWFECKVKYTKIDDNGKEKKVTEPYLVDAVSFTEAEERIFKELEAYISGEFTVTNIRKANYSDIFTTEDGNFNRFYKCKVTFMSIDEAAGKEKKVAQMMLVAADSVELADLNLKKGLDGMTVDFDIVSISESPIIDFFTYFNNTEVGAKGKQLAIERDQRELERRRKGVYGDTKELEDIDLLKGKKYVRDDD